MGSQNSSSDLAASDPCCALGVRPPRRLSEQVLTDSQVNAQRLNVTFPRVKPKHRPGAAPNGVPNASSGARGR